MSHEVFLQQLHRVLLGIDLSASLARESGPCRPMVLRVIATPGTGAHARAPFNQVSQNGCRGEGGDGEPLITKPIFILGAPDPEPR